MSKVFTCFCMLMLVMSVGATAQTVTTCYPVAAADNTGSTDGVAITANSLVNGYSTEDGWMKFDTSAIPDVDEVTQIEWNFYVNATYYPYWSSTPLTTDPVGADPATLYADINAEASSGYYNYQSESSTYAPGWKMLVLGGTANADLQAGLAADWFGLGVVSRDNSTTYYVNMDGWNEVNVPYITVTHGSPAVNEACFVADSQATSGLASYSADITGGFALGSIDWEGFAATINSGTYGSELTCDISGPLGSATITLGTGATYSPGATFIGSDTTFAGGDPAGTWTFDFYETYDDGGDGLPDATWDDICFTFAAPDPCTGPDNCANVEFIGEGTYAGDTTDCTNDNTSYNLWSWPAEGLDHVYAIDIPCPGTEVCVTYTPGAGQDGIIALSNTCVDTAVTDAVAGADNTLGGDPETFCYVTSTGDAATMYLYIDTYGAGSAGPYTLDVTVTGPIANDTCETAEDVTGGGTFYGTTICAAGDYDGSGCIPYSSLAPDVVYSIDVNDGDTVDILYTPLTSYDPSFYVVGDCGDIVGTCMGGADNGLTGDPEFDSIYFDCGGTYYIILDAWSTGEGDFQLDVTVTPGVPADTFDVSMVCDPDPLTLPTQTKLRVYVTNTSEMMRQVCGGVDVTLCNGAVITNVRAGNMVLASGETKFLGWGQVIPAFPTTCNCTLVFEANAYDCTPCESTGGVVAGWTESASCGITTVCPE